MRGATLTLPQLTVVAHAMSARDKYEKYPTDGSGRCAEPSCGCPLIGNHRGRFCTARCYSQYHARAVKRGFRLYDAAMAWRATPRNHQRGASNPPTKFGDVTYLLDEFIREDRAMREKANAEREQQAS